VKAKEMSMIDVFWHPAALLHETGEGRWDAEASELLELQELHPENDVRIRNMRSILERGPIAERLRWNDGREATEDEILAVHTRAYLDSMRAFMASGGGRLPDGCTVACEESWQAALAAAGTAVEAVDAVLDGRATCSYALVRPPGHHAQPDLHDGYCFFNNAAIAAQHARDRGVERVAIVDWDVHHGNGNQACFYERSDVLTVSLHMRTGLWNSFHPQTGSPEEFGIGDGHGYNVNVELPLGSGDQAYTMALTELVVPILRQFEPDLIIGDTGQDASTFDPNGRQNVSMAGFLQIGRIVAAAAAELCEGRLVLVQEGGYARTYSAFCLHSTLEGVLGATESALPDIAYIPDDFTRARTSVEAVQSALSRCWRMPFPGNGTATG